VMGLAPDKASGSDWLDLSAKTATRVETVPIDSDYGTIAPGLSGAFSNCLKL
ncbi:hypothetical protein QR685DRAFT_431135, partial [Neurospora intermedia]